MYTGKHVEIINNSQPKKKKSRDIEKGKKVREFSGNKLGPIGKENRVAPNHVAT